MKQLSRMTLIKKLAQIERVDALIRRKGTGPPKKLAFKLKQSERYVFVLIGLMKSMGAPIYYCKHKESYCYEGDVTFIVGFFDKSAFLLNVQKGIPLKIDDKA